MLKITLMKGLSPSATPATIQWSKPGNFCFTSFYHLIETWSIWGNWSLQILISQCSVTVKHPDCPHIPDNIQIYIPIIKPYTIITIKWTHTITKIHLGHWRISILLFGRIHETLPYTAAQQHNNLGSLWPFSLVLLYRKTPKTSPSYYYCRLESQQNYRGFYSCTVEGLPMLLSEEPKSNSSWYFTCQVNPNSKFEVSFGLLNKLTENNSQWNFCKYM